MEKIQLEQLRFPVGRYNPSDDIGTDDIINWVEDIRTLPLHLENALSGLKDEELSFTYRPGSWNIQQVVHHIADSHINAYVRIKRTLTEDTPTILPYEEKLWAQMDDVKHIPIDVSINILKGIHQRLYEVIKDLSIRELSREYQHADFPESKTMAFLIGMYAWHGRHHTAHVKLARGI